MADAGIPLVAILHETRVICGPLIELDVVAAPPMIPLRIWHIAETYPPRYGGGAAIYVRDVAELLTQRGHDVRVLCTETGDQPPYSTRAERIGGVHVVRMCLPYFMDVDPDGWQVGLSAWRRHEQRIAETIRRMVRDWRPDIVNYTATRPFGEAGLLTLAADRIPVIAMLHEAWLICQRVMLLRSPEGQPCDGPSLGRCLECMYSHYDGDHIQAAAKLPWRVLKLGAVPAYRIHRRAAARRTVQAAFAYSRFMVERHLPHIPGPVRYIPLGINLAGLPAERPRRPRMPFRFGFMGGGQPSKGLADVLAAGAMLRDEGLKFELHVWGPMADAARAVITAHGMTDRALLRGMYTSEAPWAAYAEIDLALMATKVAEPYGRIVPEAAASGAPAIGPAVGGIAETIRDEIDGLLYRFGDVRELARQMRRVLTDAALYERLCGNLRPVVDTRAAVADVESFYYEVLAQSSGTRGDRE